APALHRNFQPVGYRRLRELLFAGPAIARTGSAALPDTGKFFAYPAWQGDSLSFIPYPEWMAPQQLIPNDRASRAIAIAHERDLFRRIASKWAVALPRNAETKEAVAVALE